MMLLKVCTQLMLIFLISVLSLCLVLTMSGAYLNVSASLPYGVYFAAKTGDAPLKRGDLVLACLSADRASWAFDRGYIGSGACSGYAPLGKCVLAIEGDHAVISREGIMVNGTLLPNTYPSAHDAEGLPLPAVNIDRILQPGELILGNLKHDSFDSRYLGVFDVSNILTKLAFSSTAPLEFDDKEDLR